MPVVEGLGRKLAGLLRYKYSRRWAEATDILAREDVMQYIKEVTDIKIRVLRNQCMR